jgi:hypothetical protein
MSREPELAALAWFGRIRKSSANELEFEMPVTTTEGVQLLLQRLRDDRGKDRTDPAAAAILERTFAALVAGDDSMVRRLGRKRKREEEALAPVGATIAGAASVVRDELVYATPTRVFKCVVGATATRVYPGPPGGEAGGESDGELYGVSNFISAAHQLEASPGESPDALPAHFADHVLKGLLGPKNRCSGDLKKHVLQTSVRWGPKTTRRRSRTCNVRALVAREEKSSGKSPATR